MKTGFVHLFLSRFLVSLATICLSVTTASADDITVGDLSARLDDLEKRIGEGAAGPSDPDFPANDSGGSSETLDAISKLSSKLGEIELRLAALETRQSGVPVMNTPQKISHEGDKGAVEPQKTTSSDDVSQEDSILKLLEEASPSDPKSKQSEQKAATEKVREEATKKAEATAPTLAAGGANAQYNQATSLYEKGEYAPAEKAFQQVIDTYPDDPSAKKAHYWLAESCFAQKKNAEAKVAFVKAYQKDPKGPKAPDCLLKLGLILAAQNKKKDACTAWKKLDTDYPKMSKETKKALGEAKKKYGCQ